MLLCGYCKFSRTFYSCVMPRYVSSLELSTHTSCYVTVSSLELSTHASCHAIVTSLELSTHASCHAIVSSLELSSHTSCHVTVSSQKSADVNWNLGQIANHTKNGVSARRNACFWILCTRIRGFWPLKSYETITGRISWGVLRNIKNDSFA